MEPVVIETLGCPLDSNLSKLWEEFSLESSHSHTSSDCSESADEETVTNNDDLIEQLNNLSFNDVSDSKHSSSKCSNNVTEINSLEKDNSGEFIFVQKKKSEENQSSYLLKNKKSLKFVVEDNVESTICKCLNKNFETNSKMKNNFEKISFSESLEKIENQLSSLSLKNNKLLNEYHKSDSSFSAGNESSSDDEELVESVTLRERDPTRHNRPENNKQLRTSPFTRNHTKTFKPPIDSNDSQTLGNFSTHRLNDFNSCYYGYDPTNKINSTYFERYGVVSPSSGIFASGFPTSDVTDETIEGMVSSKIAGQVFNDVIPSIANNQIVNGIVPFTVTKQRCDDVIPFTVDEILDSIVPSADNFKYASDNFSDETNDVSYFDNLQERIFSDCAVTIEEKETFLESYFEDITVVENIVKSLKDAKLFDGSSQNHVDLTEESSFLSSEEVEELLNDSSVLNQNIEVVSTINEINYPKVSQHNFHSAYDHSDSSISKALGETSSDSNLNKENSMWEISGQFYNSEYLLNNYPDLDLKNYESLLFETSDFTIVSNKIEQEILKLEEWAKREQKNVSELSREMNWNVFPFDKLDDNGIAECINTTENKICSKKNDSKRKNNNQICKSPCRTEKTKICSMLGTAAKEKLFNSSSFCKINWENEYEEIRQQIELRKLGTKKQVIHVLPRNRKMKYRGSNLHYAILSENIERVFCLVEWHKQYHDNINTAINYRDTYKKTVLDYSKEKGMNLLSAYLEENTAKSFSHIYK